MFYRRAADNAGIWNVLYITSLSYLNDPSRYRISHFNPDGTHILLSERKEEDLTESQYLSLYTSSYKIHWYLAWISHDPDTCYFHREALYIWNT